MEREKEIKCNFCNKIFEKNSELGLPEEESIIYEDENIYVMPDISPLAIGHLLIISKKHFQSFASTTIRVRQSVNDFLKFYKKKIGNRNYTVFEHGAVVPYYAGASIDHAHMHVLPYEINIRKELMMEFGISQKYDLTGLAMLGEKKQPYFFCKRSDELLGDVFEVGKVPSQILRKIVNRLIGEGEDYDWKNRYKTLESQLLYYKTLVWWNSLDLKNTFKWKKKLLLEKFGFLDYQKLIYEVQRFGSEEIPLLKLLIKKELEINWNDNRRYRVILVPLDHQFHLPNYIIQTEEDMAGLEAFLQTNKFSEVWYMSNRNENEQVYSGRMSIFKQGLFSETIIEMIEGDDLRKLERYSIGNEMFPYFRARKNIGQVTFEIEENSILNFNVKILEVFERVKKELLNYDQNIQLLCEILQELDIRVISIDFRVENEKLVFIDWDTAEDEKVLKN